MCLLQVFPSLPLENRASVTDGILERRKCHAWESRKPGSKLPGALKALGRDWEGKGARPRLGHTGAKTHWGGGGVGSLSLLRKGGSGQRGKSHQVTWGCGGCGASHVKLRVKEPRHPCVTSSCPPSLLSEAPWFGSQPLRGCPELSQGGWLELGAETEQVHASRGEQGRGQAWREEPLGHWHIWLGGVLLTA